MFDQDTEQNRCVLDFRDDFLLLVRFPAKSGFNQREKKKKMAMSSEGRLPQHVLNKDQLL
jgi:hypothetical protein